MERHRRRLYTVDGTSHCKATSYDCETHVRRDLTHGLRPHVHLKKEKRGRGYTRQDKTVVQGARQDKALCMVCYIPGGCGIIVNGLFIIIRVGIIS